eukprot:8001035-Ditylum_brightwellii.AAC.1
MASYILEMKRVRCLEKFVNITTLALEDRGGYLKKVTGVAHIQLVLIMALGLVQLKEGTMLKDFQNGGS